MSLLAYSNNKQLGKQKVYGVPSAFSFMIAKNEIDKYFQKNIKML